MFRRNASNRVYARMAILPFCVPEPPELPPDFKFPHPMYWESWAREQGVTAILYRNLRGNMTRGIDERTLDRMEITFIDCILQDELISETIKHIASASKSRGLDMIFLKGATIAKRYYADSSMRPAGDIDILIRRDDIDKCKDLMLSLNFRMDRPELENLRRTKKSELRYFSPKTSMFVETHWDFVNSKTLRKNLLSPDESLWARAETMMIDGIQINVLSKEHLIVYHCIHLAHHHQISRLIWLIDLLQIARHSEDVFRSRRFWDLCLESNGSRFAVFTCMRLAKQVFPWMPAVPGIEKLLPERFLTKTLLNFVDPMVILSPESFSIKYRKKLFREALKLHA